MSAKVDLSIFDHVRADCPIWMISDLINSHFKGISNKVIAGLNLFYVATNRYNKYCTFCRICSLQKLR